MKLEDQLTNLELSKKLKELGVKQDSLYSWKTWNRDDSIDLFLTSKVTKYGDRFSVKNKWSAFTVAELGEKLPTNFEEECRIVIEKNGDNPWTIEYRTLENDVAEFEEIEDFNEANLRAKMLIYLIENDLLL